MPNPLMIRQTLLRPAAVTTSEPVEPEFDPASLFSSGEQGAVYDYTDASNLSTDTGGTTGVVNVGDQVFHAVDLSGNDNHIIRNAGTPIWGGLPSAVGAQVCDSPEFETPADWTEGTGWSVSTGVATKTAGTASSLSQSISLTPGTAYRVAYSIKTYTAGTVTVKFSGTTDVTAEDTYDQIGTYNEVLTAVTGNNTIEIVADASFAGTVTLVSVEPVTSWAVRGVRSRGAERLQSSAFDMSASNAMTTIFAIRRTDIAGNMYFGQVAAGATTGTNVRFERTGAFGVTGRDGTGASDRVYTDLSEDDNLYSDRGGMMYTSVLDLDESLIADQHIIRINGRDEPTSHTGTDLTTAAMPASAKVTLLSWMNNSSFSRAIITRSLTINRVLTPSELADAEAWVSQSAPRVCTIGDSVYDAASTSRTATLFEPETITLVGPIMPVANLATWGDDITKQNPDWTALPTSVKDDLDVVVVGVGHNDVKGRVDSGATIAQVMSDYQDLVDEIRGDVPESCKIIGVQLIPCDAWLDTATNAANCKAAWDDFNEALTGVGANAITGLDAVVTSHVAILDDGSGNLKTFYNSQDDGIHPNTLGRGVIAQAIRSTLVSLGLIT